MHPFCLSKGKLRQHNVAIAHLAFKIGLWLLHVRISARPEISFLLSDQSSLAYLSPLCITTAVLYTVQLTVQCLCTVCTYVSCVVHFSFGIAVEFIQGCTVNYLVFYHCDTQRSACICVD